MKQGGILIRAPVGAKAPLAMHNAILEPRIGARVRANVEACLAGRTLSNPVQS